jgi:aminoglycoside 2'-N-acetyltransferase I
VTFSIRRAATRDLTSDDVDTLRRLFAAAWDDGAFADSDWDHATGGTHVIAEDGGLIVSHASVVERLLEVGGEPIRTGYVEAVATSPQQQRRGYGRLVMEEIREILQAGYALGALSTGSHGFYERLGWERWRGPTWVRASGGVERTPDDDGGIMVLRTPTSPALDLKASIVCEWREGDVW